MRLRVEEWVLRGRGGGGIGVGLWLIRGLTIARFAVSSPDLVWVEVSTDGAVEAYLVALQLALGHSNCADPTPIQLLKDDSRHEIAKSVCEWVK